LARQARSLNISAQFATHNLTGCFHFFTGVNFKGRPQLARQLSSSRRSDPRRGVESSLVAW
jgi:hypothetical protein